MQAKAFGSKVYKVHKVCKVTGVLRIVSTDSSSCREQSAPQGSKDLIVLIDFRDFRDLFVGFLVFGDGDVIRFVFPDF